MQAAIMLIEPEARTTVVTVAVIAPIAPYIDAESACACGRGDTDGDGRQSVQHEFPHHSSPLVVTPSKTNAALVCCREHRETFLNARSPSWRECPWALPPFDLSGQGIRLAQVPALIGTAVLAGSRTSPAFGAYSSVDPAGLAARQYLVEKLSQGVSVPAIGIPR